jgi:hypothetical protein
MDNLILKPRPKAAQTQLGHPLQNTTQVLVSFLTCKSFRETTPYMAYAAVETGSIKFSVDHGRVLGGSSKLLTCNAVEEGTEELSARSRLLT